MISNSIRDSQDFSQFMTQSQTFKVPKRSSSVGGAISVACGIFCVCLLMLFGTIGAFVAGDKEHLMKRNIPLITTYTYRFKWVYMAKSCLITAKFFNNHTPLFLLLSLCSVSMTRPITCILMFLSLSD